MPWKACDMFDLGKMLYDHRNRNIEHDREQDPEQSRNQTNDKRFRVEDMRYIFFRRSHRPQDTDLLFAFQDRNIGDDPDHDARNDQLNRNEPDQDIRDHIDDIADSREHDADHIVIRNDILIFSFNFLKLVVLGDHIA